MLTTAENHNGAAAAVETTEEVAHRFQVNGTNGHTDRLRASWPAPPDVSEDRPAEGPPALALFSYDDPTGPVGKYIARLAAALAARGYEIHHFSRMGYASPASGVSIHVIGECPGDDLPAQVQEFTTRACNAFLRQFPAGSAPRALLGFEWPSVQALSLLRGIKDVNALLSLHSVERQRSDIGSPESKQIEALELAGLRETRAVILHDPATIEVIKSWAPECVDRVTPTLPRFPLEQFSGVSDPGVIKARHQIGPIDPTILYIGDLDERYGPDLLVKAMPGVLRNHPQARLVVVGDGSLHWPLRVYARYLLIEHAVRLAGHVADQPLRELVQAADLVVVPSRESTPWWPILAAWAAGRPVVATHPAAPGLLDHESDGVLTYASENSLVWGIERVLYDADLRRALAEHGRAKLDKRLGWTGLALQVEELLGVAVRS
jgi:glycosyltransferase involved in cell wall biosynthesis